MTHPPLNARLIQDQLESETPGLVDQVLVEPALESTNSMLISLGAGARVHGVSVLTEDQTAGRGRQNRRWVATAGQNLAISLGWCYPTPPQDLGALSLAIGVAVLEALESMGVGGLGLKWPNDLVSDDRKLGGVLIDAVTLPGGSITAIAGVGLNVEISDRDARLIDRAWTDLYKLTANRPDRNQLAARCISRMAIEMDRFPCSGVLGILDRWRRVDALFGRPISVSTQDAERAEVGVAEGVDDAGRLLLRVGDNDLRTYLCGEVRVRMS